MLVAMFNVVKVESVPLKSMFFCVRRVDSKHGGSSAIVE
jgi:hypothetical protein